MYCRTLVLGTYLSLQLWNTHSRNRFLTSQDKPKHIDGLLLFTGLALELVAVIYGTYLVYVSEFYIMNFAIFILVKHDWHLSVGLLFF